MGILEASWSKSRQAKQQAKQMDLRDACERVPPTIRWQVFGVTSALDRNPGRSALNLLQVGGSKLEIYCLQRSRQAVYSFQDCLQMFSFISIVRPSISEGRIITEAAKALCYS